MPVPPDLAVALRRQFLSGGLDTLPTDRRAAGSLRPRPGHLIQHFQAATLGRASDPVNFGKSG
jgi:hypothetical protein